MPADSTLPQISLSPAYRHVQRLLSTWLETGPGSDGAAFTLRAALGTLDIVEYDRLSRWLAWMCLAARSQGDATPAARLKRLDTALGSAVRMAMHKLPGGATSSGHLWSLSA